MKKIKLSILIPVYNEEKTLKKVLGLIKAENVPGIEKEIVVVNDGSTDSSSKILKLEKEIRLFHHKVNKGKGAALLTAFKKSNGDIFLIQDADLEYDPKYYNSLLTPIIENTADVVYGTRLKNYPLRITGSKKTPLITHYLGNKLLSLVTTVLFGQKISDMETGFKVFKRKVIKGMKFNSKGFDFEPEFTAKILKKGYRIYEIPIKTNPRGYNEGKKITWKDGFVALKTLLRYRFMN